MTSKNKVGKKEKAMNLMIAEDHTLTAKLLGKLLAKSGKVNVVAIVADGKSVLEVLNQESVDIILMDLSMPLLDGLETMNILFKTHPFVKVLVLSGHSDSRFIERSLQLGASGYLTKKADTSEVLDALIAVFTGGSYLDKTSLDALVYGSAFAQSKTMGVH